MIEETVHEMLDSCTRFDDEPKPELKPMESQPESCKFDDSEKKLTPLQRVYRWAASGVSDSGYDSEIDRFYETPVYKSLLFKLQNTDKSLSMLTGLQGTGKTRILYQLRNNDCFYFKWNKDWKEELWRERCVEWYSIQRRYNDNLAEEYENQVRASLVAGASQKANKAGDPRTILGRKDYGSMEAFLGKAKCKELKEQAISGFLYCIKIFLIDMPDYSKSNANAMNHDIAGIQEFYESLENKANTHFVIGVQKELVLKNPHFWWGKCDKYVIEPLYSQQLIEAYNLSNPESGVFAPVALQYLAEISRGVFRRFKKYMRLSIEADQEQKVPISEDIVKSAITDQVIFEDMDQELADVFDDEEKRRCASAILGYLRTHSDVNVKTIAEDTEISETMAQKIVQKLLLYKYISAKHGEGKEKLVSLQL